LIGTHVDSQFYCCSSGGHCWYDCKVPDATLYTDTAFNSARNVFADLLELGTDPLKITVDYCRENELEVFASVRMNDNHASNHYLRGAIPDIKVEHPEWLFGSIRRDPAAATRNPDDCPEPERARLLHYQRSLKTFEGHLSPRFREYIVDSQPTTTESWSPFDLAVPEVRDFTFRIFEDIATRHDIDGIHMNFLRHPPFFKSVAWGDSVSDAETEAMTDLVRRIRSMTEDVGRGRGRPLLLAATVLDSVALNAWHGLDIRRWLADELIDLLIFGWVQAAPIEEMIDLGHRYDTPVYVHLNCGARFGTLGDRARAMHGWHAGADGMYLFNYFPGFKNMGDCTWDMLRELGEPEELQKLDKIYCTVPFARTFEFFDRFMSNSKHLITTPLVAPQHPREVSGDAPLVVPYFPVGDDVFWGQSQGKLPRLELRIMVEDIEEAGELRVEVNGRVVPDGTLDNGVLSMEPHPDMIAQGNNRIAISLRAEDRRGAKVSDIQLSVKYMPAEQGRNGRG